MTKRQKNINSLFHISVGDGNEDIKEIENERNDM